MYDRLRNTLMASKVLLIRCSRHWVRTCTTTSSGISLRSTNWRRKSYSIWEAAGKPISISLNPSFTRRLNISIFSSTTIGSTSAALPSRRSTLHQIGAFSISLFGHSRPGNLPPELSYISCNLTCLSPPSLYNVLRSLFCTCFLWLIFRQHPNFRGGRNANASEIWAQLTKNHLTKSSTERFREHITPGRFPGTSSSKRSSYHPKLWSR